MNKLLLITILTAGILIIGFLFLLSFFGSKKTSESIKPVIQASFAPSSTTATPTGVKTLKLTKVSPTEDTNQTYFPILQIYFTFSEPMNPATFIVNASPDEKIIASLKPDDPNTIIVSPDKNWQPGITTITISTDTISAKGARLNQPISYKVNTQFPKNPPPDITGY